MNFGNNCCNDNGLTLPFGPQGEQGEQGVQGIPGPQEDRFGYYTQILSDVDLDEYATVNQYSLTVNPLKALSTQEYVRISNNFLNVGVQQYILARVFNYNHETGVLTIEGGLIDKNNINSNSKFVGTGLIQSGIVNLDNVNNVSPRQNYIEVFRANKFLNDSNITYFETTDDDIVNDENKNIITFEQSDVFLNLENSFFKIENLNNGLFNGRHIKAIKLKFMIPLSPLDEWLTPTVINGENVYKSGSFSVLMCHGSVSSIASGTNPSNLVRELKKINITNTTKTLVFDVDITNFQDFFTPVNLPTTDGFFFRIKNNTDYNVTGLWKNVVGGGSFIFPRVQMQVYI